MNRKKSMLVSFHGAMVCTKRGITLDHHTILTFNDPEREGFFKTWWGKGENAGYQHFILVPQCFLPCHKTEITAFCEFSSLGCNNARFARAWHKCLHSINIPSMLDDKLLYSLPSRPIITFVYSFTFQD